MYSTLILGLGNILYADEGIGVRTAEFLYNNYDFFPHVPIVDGGTQGMALLGVVEQAQRLLVLDAVDFALPKGTVVYKEAEEVPKYLSAQKHSVHQGSFSEVLALASLRDKAPQECVLIGMQPCTLSLGAPLSSMAHHHGIPSMAHLALQCLKNWGINAELFHGTRHLHHPSIKATCFENQDRKR